MGENKVIKNGTYCRLHQGDGSHYDDHNCTVCKTSEHLRNVGELYEQRNNQLLALQEKTDALAEALQLAIDDLLQRAEVDSAGFKVVNIGGSVWRKMKNAISQYNAQPVMDRGIDDPHHPPPPPEPPPKRFVRDDGK